MKNVPHKDGKISQVCDGASLWTNLIKELEGAQVRSSIISWSIDSISEAHRPSWSSLCFPSASLWHYDLRKFTKALDDIPIWKHFFHQSEISSTASFWWFISVDLRWLTLHRRQYVTVHEITNNYLCITIQLSGIHLADILESTQGYSCQYCI